jgi:hypothetical protein
MVMGDPLDPKTDIGTIISKSQYERVNRYVEEGKVARFFLVRRRLLAFLFFLVERPSPRASSFRALSSSPLFPLFVSTPTSRRGKGRAFFLVHSFALLSLLLPSFLFFAVFPFYFFSLTSSRLSPRVSVLSLAIFSSSSSAGFSSASASMIPISLFGRGLLSSSACLPCVLCLLFCPSFCRGLLFRLHLCVSTQLCFEQRLKGVTAHTCSALPTDPALKVTRQTDRQTD